MDESSQLTLWLSLMRRGDQHARERVIEAVHTQLRVIAARLLQRERANHTLEPNALVNELCIRLFGKQPLSYTDRAHFFAIAAQTMRRILIDHARAGLAGKRGGERQRVSLSGVDGWSPLTRNEEILALDAALAKLSAVDARAAQVVEMRFFGGLQEDEVAEVLGVSTITVKRDWKAARAWLIFQLQPR